uniref:Uncharacterized protein n=1 Tax=Anguilla anguilla TaxID=7936 RepID=A0A0E9V060_ANGAN
MSNIIMAFSTELVHLCTVCGCGRLKWRASLR